MEIRFQNVVKKYGTTAAVKDLNLTIESGALHFLLGPSGCGKTTTLRMLAGLESVSSGQIYFGNQDVTESAASERGIGMVFQSYALYPSMTVRQNIAFGLGVKKVPKAEQKQIVDRVAETLQITHLLDRRPAQLSGGQRQRVGLKHHCDIAILRREIVDHALTDTNFAGGHAFQSRNHVQQR